MLIVHGGSSSGSPFPLPAAAEGPMLVAKREHFPAGTRIAPHRHPRGQFLFATTGTMFVRTAGHAWMVPPSLALWIPAGLEHAIDAHGDLQMRTLYLNAASAETLPQRCVVLNVTPLLRELILRMTSDPPAGNDPAAELIGRLTVLEISRLPPCTLELPMPYSPDLLDMCEQVLQQPARRSDTGRAMASARTLYRRFHAETGLSFVQWRKQACLLHAVRRLSAGEAVTRVALDLGYDSPSAFSTMFRRTLGVTPRAFLPGPKPDLPRRVAPRATLSSLKGLSS
ncbi:MAG: helix-turn-helix transcriptional regulator [Pigmentiphaga sp.]